MAKPANRHQKINAVNDALQKTEYRALTFNAIGRGYCYRLGNGIAFLGQVTAKKFEDLSVEELVKFAAAAEAIAAEDALRDDKDEDDDSRVGEIAYSYVYTSNKPGEAEEMRSTVHVTVDEGDAMQIDDHVANVYRICRVTKENAAVYIEKFYRGNPNHRNLIVRFIWSEEHQLPLYDYSAHDAKLGDFHANLFKGRKENNHE